MAKSFDELVMRSTTAATRKRAALRTRELLAEMLLREVREMTGTTQRELAKALGIKQPSLSKLENQGDMQISTLTRIVETLGGELRVMACFPDVTVRVKPFDRKRRRTPVRRTRAKAPF